MRGCIRTVRPGVHQLIWDAPRGTGGKRQKRYRTYYGPKKDAQRRLAEIIHEVANGTFFEPSRMGFGEFLDYWLEHTGDGLAAKSRERYRSIIERHLKPALGHHPISKLTPLQIQSYYTAALKGDGDGSRALSPATVLKHHHIVHRALRQALRWQLIARNPADAVEPPKAAHTEMRALDPTQTAALLAAAQGGRLYVSILVAVSTGLRRGELLGLRWCDLDLAGGTLAVRQTIEQTSAGIAFKQPKTAKSRRTLPLGEMAVAALRHHRAEQVERLLAAGQRHDEADLVFTLPDGSPWSPAAFSVAFQRLLRASGLPHLRLHDLRHTHASMLLSAGVHPKVVSERLGHANIAITMDTYSHVLPGIQQEAVRQFDLLLTSAVGEPPAS
jgi:integrase